MNDAASTISIQAFRYDPDGQQESYFQSYEVESTEPLSVMALLAKKFMRWMRRSPAGLRPVSRGSAVPALSA